MKSKMITQNLIVLYSQQNYYGRRCGAVLRSYYTGTYTKVTVCFFEVATMLPLSTHAGTPTE